MGARFPSAFSNTLLTASIVTTSETLLLTTPPLPLPKDGATVLLFASMSGTTAAGTNSITQRLRRGTALTSPQLNVGNSEIAAASNGVHDFLAYIDTPGAVDRVQYSLTTQLGLATGNFAVSDGMLFACSVDGLIASAVSTTLVTTVLASGGAETIVCTTPPLLLPNDEASVLLLWYGAFATGASVTATTTRIRRGPTTGGTLVNVGNPISGGATQNRTDGGCYLDQPGAAGLLQYSLGIVGVGSTGTGTMQDACLMALVL